MLGPSPAENEAGEQGKAHHPHDGRQWIGPDRTACAGGLPGRGLGYRAALVAHELGRFVQPRLRDGACLLRELRQVIFGEIARFHRARSNRFRDAACLSFIDAVEPGHGGTSVERGNGRIRLEVPPLARGLEAPISPAMKEPQRTSAINARLHRQFERISRQVPASRGFLGWVRRPGWHIVRIPMALLLVLGGVFSFLPVLGLWMLPLGMLVLAVDVPPLRRPVGDAIVRLQRLITNSRRRLRDAFGKNR